MAALFEETRIKSLALSNRFVRSATWEGLATDGGFVTPRLIDGANQLASGKVGLIITGHAYVSPEGQAGRWQLAAYSDKFVPGLAEMAASVHRLGGKIALQVAHAGVLARQSLTGFEAFGPSPYAHDREPAAREMTVAEINAVADSFASSAVRAVTAGYDAIQIHAAHGYLLSQFLSPYFNARTDDYGGPIENRARILADVVRAIRKATSADFPVLLKMNCADFIDGGLTTEDMVHAAVMLEKCGADAIEMSGGTFLSGRCVPSRKGKPPAGEPEAYYEEPAKLYKRSVSIPLMLVGGIRTMETTERLVTEGITDYIALSRPLIREPGLIRRWQSGDQRPALCISDSRCFVPGFEGRGISCVVEERAKRQKPEPPPI
jgi:2,4-dienoyl-CoA reductase-like NADH-dependent reductase (Old Yellow Enzyme family)